MPNEDNKGPQGGAGVQSGTAPEGGTESTAPGTPGVLGGGPYAQTIDRLQNENAATRVKLKATEKELEKERARAQQLQDLFVKRAIEAQLDSAGIKGDDEDKVRSRARLEKLIRADLSIEWSDDGTFKADVDKTAKAVLKDLGFIKDDAPPAKGGEAKDKAPQSPAPATNQAAPQQQIPVFPHVAQRPHAGQQVPVVQQPRSLADQAVQLLEKYGAKSSG